MDASIPRQVGNPRDPDTAPLETREWIDSREEVVSTIEESVGPVFLESRATDVVAKRLENLADALARRTPPAPTGRVTQGDPVGRSLDLIERAIDVANEHFQDREAEYARAGEGIGETKMQSLSVSRERLEQKFLKLTSIIPQTQRTELLARLNDLENVKVAELFKF